MEPRVEVCVVNLISAGAGESARVFLITLGLRAPLSEVFRAFAENRRMEIGRIMFRLPGAGLSTELNGGETPSTLWSPFQLKDGPIIFACSRASEESSTDPVGGA